MAVGQCLPAALAALLHSNAHPACCAALPCCEPPPCPTLRTRSPEAGLGAAAGGAGLLLARLRGFRLQAERREQLYVLSSMCSIFSGLMPNAMTAVLLVLELGGWGL